jgi:hypothetical protein
MFASSMTAGSLVLVAALAGAPAGEPVPAPAPDARQAKAALLGCLTRNFIELGDGSSSSEVLGRTIVARCRLEVAACATINSCDAARLAPAAVAPKAASAKRRQTAARSAKPAPEKSWVASLAKPRVLSQKVWRFITKELRAGHPLAEGRS